MYRLLLAVVLVCAVYRSAWAENKLAERIVGTWVRVVDGHHVTLDIKPDGLHIAVEMPGGMTVTAEADYVVSDDGVLLGVVRTRLAEEKKKHAIRERTFSGRIAVTEKTLTVKESECKTDGVQILVDGKFKRSTKDAPAVTKAFDKTKGSADQRTSGMTLPSSRYLAHPPQYVPAGPTFPLTSELARMEEARPFGSTPPKECHGGPSLLDHTVWLEAIAEYLFGGCVINHRRFR